MRVLWSVTVLALATVVPSRPVDAQGVDTVLVGSRSLQGVRMSLTSDTLDSYKLSGGDRTPTSTTIRTVTLVSDGSEPRYVIRTLHWAPERDTSVSLMTVRASDLSLVQHSVRAAHDSAAVTATATHLSAWVVLPNQPVRLIDRVLERPVFPVEGQIPWLLPLLPLAPGYRAVIPHYSPWEDREAWNPIEVIAAERVEVHGHHYDCWKVDAGPLGPPGYRMIRWVDRKSRRIVQSVLRGPKDQPEYWSHLRP